MGEVDLQKIFSKAHNDSDALSQLLEIGRTQGFHTTINRRIIWPFLLKVDSKQPVFQWKKNGNQVSLQYQQLRKDAERTLSRYQTYSYTSKFYTKKKQNAILDILNAVFAKNKQINYLQGFHQITSIFTILFDDSTAFYLTEKVSQSYYHDLLTEDLQKLVTQISLIIYELTILEDPALKNTFGFYPQNKILHFILSWFLTWFTHGFNSLSTIFRIWDYILCSGPHALFYLIAGVIVSFHRELTSRKNCNEAQIQQFFQTKTKNNQINAEHVIQIALLIQQKYELSQLKSFQKLSKNSMFRLQNFYREIPIHKIFHENRIQKLKKQKKMNTILKVGGFLLIATGAIVFRKQIQVKLEHLKQ